MIEKIVHQMWFQGVDAVPAQYHAWQTEWKRLHPDHAYILWDESRITDFLRSDFPSYVSRWQQLDRVIKKCDAARYFILHHFGGIYADLDTRPYRRMDQLLIDLCLTETPIILSEESHDPEAWKAGVAKQVASERKLRCVVGNAILISRKHQAFWLQFLDRSFQVSHRSVLDSFSTWHLTEFLERFEHGARIAVIPSRHLLERNYQGESTYATHRYDATWFDHGKQKPWEG